jgi:hypothetical protein
MSKMLVSQLIPLLPFMYMLGASLVTAAVLKILGLVSTGAFLTLMGGGYFANKKPKAAESTVNIETGKFFKIGWQGPASVGLMVAGVLTILLAFWTTQGVPNF